jgi:hypothetical protein
MRTLKTLTLLSLFSAFLFSSCTKDIEVEELSAVPAKAKGLKQSGTSFNRVTTIDVGGLGAAEISAFDPKTDRLFVVNVEYLEEEDENDDEIITQLKSEISVFDISEVDNPEYLTSISITGGSPNSVAVQDGKLAVAVEDSNKQANGRVEIYDTSTFQPVISYTVGALPDMVTFSPNGKYIVVANEGEPSQDYLVDPKGSVSIIKPANGQVTTLDFEAFNDQEASLEQQGFRVFGEGPGGPATLAEDVEPEYVVISDNSRIAWVSLQENNGVARINLNTATIEAIYPLGFKDYNDPWNAIDPNDRDNVKILREVPVFGMFQPDGMAYAKIGGMDIVVTANEGDARDYEAFSEEERLDDITLDPSIVNKTIFGDLETLLQPENLGDRLEITTTLGDEDGDGLYEELYSYGARSFSIWSGTGQLLYDSGNDVGTKTLALTPDRFNDNDGRSDAKGGEPESVAILEVNPNQFLLFVGLERNDQVLVYDISNPYQPEFLDILSNIGVDEAPEGLLVVEAKDSPTGNALLIVSNEDSGTVSIYQNGGLEL